jgi:cytidyltransferase-like protein
MYYDVIVLSGGFDPMHVGHLRMIQESAKMANIVVAGVNSDEWLMRKKGYVFMPHEERVEMVQGTRGVSKAMAFDDDDNSACDLLRCVRALWPNFKVAFANGGDRTSDNIPEIPVAEELDVHLIWGVGGGKVQSSSDLVSAQPRLASLRNQEKQTT